MEQSYTANRAVFAKDYLREAQIMASSDPVKILHIVKDINVNRAEWAVVESSHMEYALMAKYGQNPSLLRALLATGDRQMTEANAHDSHWGIGVGMKDPQLQHRQDYNGQNLLGKLLDTVRADYRNKTAASADNE